MPTLDDALEFVQDDEVSDEQLRRACRILGLDQEGDRGALRERLLKRLAAHDPAEPVVCLNPNVPA